MFGKGSSTIQSGGPYAGVNMMTIPSAFATGAAGAGGGGGGIYAVGFHDPRVMCGNLLGQYPGQAYMQQASPAADMQLVQMQQHIAHQQVQAAEDMARNAVFNALAAESGIAREALKEEMGLPGGGEVEYDLPAVPFELTLAYPVMQQRAVMIFGALILFLLLTVPLLNAVSTGGKF